MAFSILSHAGHKFGDIVIHGGTNQLGDQYAFTLPSHVELASKSSRLLDSLRHDDMNARACAIEDAQEETFHWLFETSDEGSEQTIQDWKDDKTPPCGSQVEPVYRLLSPCLHRFPAWLSNGGRTFLIEGKPGSGKSTLMKFIRDNSHTRKLLPQVSEFDPVVVACHFFWLAGSKLQRSYKGLLSSLSFQILRQLDNTQIPIHSSEVAERRFLSDWAEKDLEKLLVALVGSLKNGSCIMIDGLDEFDQSDRPHRLISLLNRLKAFPMVRICVSSRPLPWLKPQVALCPSLQLHQLTAGDIASLASQTLQEEFKFYASTLQSEQTKILRVIEEKAEGVFLWVRYALHSLSQGICAFDDSRTLIHRLEELPSGMEKLFKHMWQRHKDGNERHREEAAEILYCGKFLDLPLFNLMVVFDGELSRHYLTTLRPSDDCELEFKCEAMMKRLMVRTAGLFVCERVPCHTILPGLRGPKAVRRSSEIPPSLMRTGRVSYLHRTVHDFLWGTEFGRSIVAVSNKQIKNLRRQVLHGHLAAVIEDLKRLDAQEVHLLCQYVVDQVDSDFESIQLVESTLHQLVKERRRIEGREIFSNWYHELQEYDNTQDVYSDFVGLLVDLGAFDAVKSYISEKDPTALYKGYILAVALSRLQYYPTRWRPGITPLIKWLLDNGADVFTRQALPTKTKHCFWLAPFEIAMVLVFHQLCERQYTDVLQSVGRVIAMIDQLPRGSTFLVPIRNFRSSGIEVHESGCFWLFNSTTDILTWARIDAESFCKALIASFGQIHIDTVDRMQSHDFDIRSHITDVVYITLNDSPESSAAYDDAFKSPTFVPGSAAKGLVLSNMNVSRPSSRLFPDVLPKIHEACRNCEEVSLLDELERLGLLLRADNAYIPPSIDDVASPTFAPQKKLQSSVR